MICTVLRGRLKKVVHIKHTNTMDMLGCKLTLWNGWNTNLTKE